MNNRQPQQNFNLVRAAKKLFLSAFVVVTFFAYALHNKNGSNPTAKVGLAATGKTANTGQVLSPTDPAPTNTSAAAPTATSAAPFAGSDDNSNAAVAAPTSTPAAAPTDTPAPAQPAQQNGLYKDGTYTGPEVDATYGYVKVQATVQNGKISNVQFLEYPNDRRTSQRINAYAVPYLTQEALQAQNANVDLITGATLTSEAFQQSLQSALDQAKSVQ